MAVNARTEKFQHIEVFDKPALFTNGRIARDTVPKGWYCYDIRGSDDDPGELCYMEENVVVNHAGSVLMPEKLAMCGPSSTLCVVRMLIVWNTTTPMRGARSSWRTHRRWQSQ